ncbi:hypothetical protein H1R20_g12850, partial [Candolleomyces eurysporus]
MYERYQSTTRKYQPFWDFINPAFLEKWPILPAGTKVEDLDETAFKNYSESLNKLYERIKMWYRWKCGTRSRNTSSTVTSKDIKEVYADSGTRQAKEYEVFVKLNNNIFVPEWNEECQRQGLRGRSKLTVWHKVARKLWDKATEDQKAAVRAYLATSLKDGEGTDLPDPCTPSDYQKYWEKIPALLSKTVAPVVRKAGVLVFLTVVGPVPQAGGQILATSYVNFPHCSFIVDLTKHVHFLAGSLQFGDKPETPLFSNIWVDHDRVLVNQLASFAGHYEFTPDICAQRSLLHAQKPETNLKAPDLGEGPSGEQGVPASQDLGDPVNPAGEGSSSEAPVTPPTNQTTGQPEAPSSPVAPNQTASFCQSSIVPPPLTQPNSTITIGGTSFTYDPTNFNIPDFDFDLLDEAEWANSEVLETMMRSNAPPILSNESVSEEAYHLGTAMPNLADPGSNTPANAPHALHAPAFNILANTPPIQHAPVPHIAAPTRTVKVQAPNVYVAASTGQAPPSTHAPVPAMSPVVVPPAIPAQDAQAKGIVVTPPSTNVPIVGPPPVRQPAASAPPMAPTSVLASTPATIMPPVAPTSTSVPALPSLHAPATNVLPLAPPGSNSNAGTLVSFQPSTITMPTTWSTAPATTTNTAAVQSSFSLHVSNNSTPAFNIDIVKATDQIQQDRAPFQDLDNGIRRSSRAPVPSTRLEKLNKIGDNILPPRPPPGAIGEPEEPSWFAPTYKYLKNSSLGQEWDSLVEKWAGYEQMKGWKSGKGLPAKGRPEEWSQWTSKARHGARNYKSTPNVEDPNELGIYIGKWVATFNDADFGRTGPNGVVSLLTMMVWWGIPALTPSSWNDDSRPQWRILLQDLIRRFDGLLTNTAKRPYEGSGTNENQENKR